MVKLIALLKRKSGISQDEFAHRWLAQHTKISTQLPGLLEYRINIATSRQEAGKNEPLFDGTAELWWESIDVMEAAFDTDVGRAAGADADTFCEARVHIYTEEHVVLPKKEG